MNIKISGALKRIYTVCFRSSPQKCQSPKVPTKVYPNQDTIKLATVRITPNLKMLSFRVSKNYLLFSFARPGTDLLEFNELCNEEELTEMLEEMQDQEERKPSYWKRLTRSFRCCYKDRYDDGNSEYYRIETHSLMIIPEQSAEDLANQVYFCTVKSRVSENSPGKTPSNEAREEDPKTDQKEEPTEEKKEDQKEKDKEEQKDEVQKEIEEEKPQCSKSIKKEKKYRIKKTKKAKEKPIPVVNCVEK